MDQMQNDQEDLDCFNQMMQDPEMKTLHNALESNQNIDELVDQGLIVVHTEERSKFIKDLCSASILDPSFKVIVYTQEMDDKFNEICKKINELYPDPGDDIDWD